MKKKIVNKSKQKTAQNKTKSESKINHVYGIIGMVALFLVGVVFGYIINGSDHVNRSIMTQTECQNLAEHIGHLVQTNNFEHLKVANEVYSENCLNREFKQPKPQPKPKAEVKKLPETTCGKIEMLLKNKLYPSGSDADSHIENAKIYANLSERGCPENSQKYKGLAAQELDIARALNDDDLNKKDDTIEIVETYKRLQMQKEAERMIEKAKKLTNPAIDFIIELEKIIEE